MKYLLLIVLLTGCYNQRKAQQQFSRAATFDQKIGSDYCAAQFPSTSTTVHDTLRTSDSTKYKLLLAAANDQNDQADRTIDSLLHIEPPDIKDTSCYKIIASLKKQNEALKYSLNHLPPIENKTQYIDSITKEGGQTAAALKSCQIDNSRLIAQADKTDAKLARVQKTNTTLWWLVILLGISTGGLLASKIKGLFKSPLKLPV